MPSAIGPLTRSLDTIHLTMSSLIHATPWEMDARCVPIPWREDMYNEALSRPLTIGVLFDDDVVRPNPPITRVLRSAVEALRAAGHDIIEWNADLHEECVRVMVRSRRRIFLCAHKLLTITRTGPVLHS